MLCANCRTDNSANAKFCKGCGQPLAEPPVHSLGCPRCTTSNPPGARFCKACGFPLTSSGAPERDTSCPQREPDSIAPPVHASDPDATLLCTPSVDDATLLSVPAPELATETVAPCSAEATLVDLPAAATNGAIGESHPDATLIGAAGESAAMSPLGATPPDRTERSAISAEDATVRYVPVAGVSEAPVPATVVQPVLPMDTDAAKRRGGKEPWWAIAGVVIGIALGAGGVWYLMDRGDKARPETNASQGASAPAIQVAPAAVENVATTPVTTAPTPQLAEAAPPSPPSPPVPESPTVTTSAEQRSAGSPASSSKAAGAEKNEPQRAPRRAANAGTAPTPSSPPGRTGPISSSPPATVPAPGVPPWLDSLRSELSHCEKKSGLTNYLCTDRARNKHCPGHWNTVKECEMREPPQPPNRPVI